MNQKQINNFIKRLKRITLSLDDISTTIEYLNELENTNNLIIQRALHESIIISYNRTYIDKNLKIKDILKQFSLCQKTYIPN